MFFFDPLYLLLAMPALAMSLCHVSHRDSVCAETTYDNNLTLFRPIWVPLARHMQHLRLSDVERPAKIRRQAPSANTYLKEGSAWPIFQ